MSMSTTEDRNSSRDLSRHEGETPATRRSRDEDWHERARWTPTAEEFQRYLDREVEMAKANIAKGNSANSTLHSSATITRAQEPTS